MSCPGLGGGEGAIEADTARSVCRGIANDLSRQRDNRFKGHPFRLSTITIVGIGRDGNVIDARGPYRRYSNLRYMRTSLNPLVERQPRRCSTFSAGEAGFARLGFEAPVTDGSRCMRTTLLSGSTVPVADDAKPASGAGVSRRSRSAGSRFARRGCGSAEVTPLATIGFVVARTPHGGCYRICYRTRWHVPG